MSGLLAKAKILRDRVIGGSREPSSADFLKDKEKDIMAEMDSILEKNRLKITDSTLNFTAQSSGTMFPAIINLGALALLALLGFGFYLVFNQSEASLVSEKRQVSSAEGRIIEAVRRASQEELARKEAEIGSIQGLLRDAERSKASLAADTEKELQNRTAKLKEELAAELEAERQRLLREGVGREDMAARLAAFEERKQREHEDKLAAVNLEFEDRLRKASAELNDKMEGIRRSLAQAQTEQDALKASMEDKLALARREAERARAEASAEKNAAAARLEDLGKKQEEIRLVENRILSMYDAVNTRIRGGDYKAALEQLDRLEEFLGSPGAARVESVAERRGIEQFLIDSLRRLINSEIAARSPPQSGDGGESTRALLGSITRRVEEGNRLFEAGKIEAAREEYTAALRQIPELETGYARLKDIENLRLAGERRLLEERLAEGDRLYKSSQYKTSVDRYREALRLLEEETPMVNRMVTQLLDAGYRLRSAEEPPRPAPVQELPEEEKALLLRARTAEGRRRLLLEDLDRLKIRYTAASGQEGSGASQDALVTLLNAKLLIRQVLSSDEIREEYPELYNTVDAVFESYGEQQRKAGRSEALRDIVTVTEYLARGNGSAAPPLDAAEESRQRELLVTFLENLKELLGSDGGPRP